MKRMRFVLFLLFLFVCLSPLTVKAADGTIRMELPKELEGVQVFYQKGETEQSVLVGEDGKVVIPQLTSGDYKISISDAKDYEFQTIEVRVPTWSVEEERMLYDITIEPKYQKVVSTPKTGDDVPVVFYVALGGVGLMTAAMCVWMAKQKDKKQ